MATDADDATRAAVSRQLDQDQDAEDTWGAIDMGLRGAIIATKGRNPRAVSAMLLVVSDLVAQLRQ